jgi:uncharacterized membrane protein YccC
MATGVRSEIPSIPSRPWTATLAALLARELAPSPRKLVTALRMTCLATLGAAVVMICHIHNKLSTYVVWVLVGAGPMLSVPVAVRFLVAEGIALAVSMLIAQTLAETPGLLVPVVSAALAGSSYFATRRKLGAPFLLIQVVCLDLFYGVVFAPEQVGWDAAEVFAASAIAFGVVTLFDNWLWPQPSEELLMELLGADVARARARLLAASRFYLSGDETSRPQLPPATSELPRHLELLNQAVAEGLTEHRRAVLLAALTRVARINLAVDRLTLATLEKVRWQIPTSIAPEVEQTIEAIASVLAEIADEFHCHLVTGSERPLPSWRVRARTAMDALSVRLAEVRSTYISIATPAEIENFASFADSLASLTGHVDRLLDEPPRLSADIAPRQPLLSEPPDGTLARFSVKVGVCTILGYLIGILSHRPEMSTVLTTVLITAQPTFGAALHKIILRIVGAAIGGVVSLLAIIIVSKNCEKLPAYMLVLFPVFYLSAYASLTSGRIAYAGKQIGITFALVFAGLSPSTNIYGPLWRVWAILVGSVIVATVAFALWPEYAADSLLPRLRKVLEDTLLLMPGGSVSTAEMEIHRVNSETMRLLAELLEIADDAQLEGRTSMLNHQALIEATGTLRRIANRLASIASRRLAVRTPSLDPVMESARVAFFAQIFRVLQSWLNFFNSDQCLSAAEARALAASLRAARLARALAEFGSRLEENHFERVDSWSPEQRGEILAELDSMRRLEFLIADLNRWLATIPGPGTI